MDSQPSEANNKQTCLSPSGISGLDCHPKFQLGLFDGSTTPQLAGMTHPVWFPWSVVDIQQKVRCFQPPPPWKTRSFKVVIWITLIKHSQKGCLQKKKIFLPHRSIWPQVWEWQNNEKNRTQKLLKLVHSQIQHRMSESLWEWMLPSASHRVLILTCYLSFGEPKQTHTAFLKMNSEKKKL